MSLRTWSAAAARKRHRLRSVALAGLQRTGAAWRSWRSFALERRRAAGLRTRVSSLICKGPVLALAWRCWVATWESTLSENARAAARGAGLELEEALEARHR